MAITVSCEGILRTPEDKINVMNGIKALCEAEHLYLKQDEEQGEIIVCPEGIIEIEYRPDYAILKTTTSVAGAGYHAYVCELFSKLTKSCQTAMLVDDECEYLEDHDFERLRDHYFYSYLHLLLTNMKQMNEDEEATYAWDNKSYLPLAKSGCVITPMGYLNVREFCHQTLESAAKAFFIWNDLERNALFFRNCALNSLWNDCTFDTNSEAKKGVALHICEAIEKAYELDHALALPMKQYHHLCQLLNRNERIQDAKDLGIDEIGYRMEEVLYPYGCWLILEEGRCTQTFDGNTMILERHDEENEWLSTIRITGYTADQKLKEFAEGFVSRSDADDEFEWEDENIRCRGMRVQLNDENHTILIQAQLICEKETLMITEELADLSTCERAMEHLHMILYNKESERDEYDVRI